MLRPQQTYTIVRQLDDHRDTNTYYCQAVVRRSSDSSILATVNLTDQGDQRFTGDWLVAQDSTGLGFDIDITVSTYTDSGYTTKSQYGDMLQTHRVEVLETHFGGGGGGDINYKKIREIIADELNKQEKTDISGVDDVVKKIFNRVSDLPDYVIDYASQFEEVKSLVSGAKGTDLTPITQVLQELGKGFDKMRENIVIQLDQIDKSLGSMDLKSATTSMKELADRVDDAMAIKEQIKDLNNTISDTPFVFVNRPEKEEKPKVEPERPVRLRR